jgi:hypothetical protein
MVDANNRLKWLLFVVCCLNRQKFESSSTRFLRKFARRANQFPAETVIKINCDQRRLASFRKHPTTSCRQYVQRIFSLLVPSRKKATTGTGPVGDSKGSRVPSEYATYSFEVVIRYNYFIRERGYDVV